MQIQFSRMVSKFPQSQEEVSAQAAFNQRLLQNNDHSAECLTLTANTLSAHKASQSSVGQKRQTSSGSSFFNVSDLLIFCHLFQ